MKRKILCTLTAAAMIFSHAGGIFPVSAVTDNSTVLSSGTTGGNCGRTKKDSVHWRFDSKNGTLTISGKGAMADYPDKNAPWSGIIRDNKVTSVIIKEGVTAVGSHAFYNEVIPFEQLSYANAPDGANISVVSLSLPGSLTETGEGAFCGLSSLRAAEIPKGVKAVPAECFKNCKSLIKLTLPEGLEEIGNGAFEGCTSLKSVCLPESLVRIDKKAFYSCKGLSGIIIPRSVSYIGGGAFSGSGIKSMVIKGEPEFGKNALSASGLKSISVIGSKTKKSAKSCTGNSTPAVFNITAPLPENAVTSGKWGKTVLWEFDESTGILTLWGSGETSDLTKSPPWKKFAARIKKAVIRKGVSSIGSGAFSGCVNMTEAALPSGIRSIEDGAFKGCISLENVNLPGGLSHIGKEAFAECISLKSAVLPASLSETGDYVFEGSGLLSARLCEGITSTGTGIFSDCAFLESVTLPESLDKISGAMFRGCISLKEITLPAGVLSVGDYAFLNSGLEKITLPNSVTETGKYCFSECASLKSVKFSPYVTRIETGTFRDCVSLSSVKLSPAAEYIGPHAFINCSGLKTLSLPDSVTFIGESALNGCSVTSLRLPKNLSEAGSFAFSSDILAEVTFQNIVRRMDPSAFDGCPRLKTVNVTTPAIKRQTEEYFKGSGVRAVTVYLHTE